MIKTLETIIVEPSFQAKYSVIWLHGLGADGHDFVNIVPELQLPTTLAIRFIFPHAPIRPVSLNNGLAMRAWFDIKILDRNAPLDIAGLQASDNSIRALIRQEIASGIPAKNIAIVGFSQGGTLALYSGLRYTKQLAGILGLSTFFPSVLLENYYQPKTVSISIFHGEFDTVLPPKLGKLIVQDLKQQGYCVNWKLYPMGHTVCAPEIRDIAGWLITLFSNPTIDSDHPVIYGI